MRFPLVTLLVFWLCCLSCSDDDPGNILIEEENVVERFPPFSFLTTTAEGIQQFVFNTATQTGNLINLSQQDGISPVISRTYVADNVIGLYFQDRVWLKNLETGSVVMGENMFTLGDVVINNWAVNTDEAVYIGFHTDGTFEDFNVFAQNIVTDTQEQFTIGTIGQSFEPTFGSNRLAFHSNFGSGSSAITTLGLINTQTNTSITPVLLAGDFVIGTIFGEQDDLFVFSTEGRYHRYDINNLGLIETVSTDFREVLNGREQLRDNQLYYTFLQQESAITSLPAVYDLTTNENSITDITPVFQEIQTARSYTDLQPTDMRYSFLEEAWIIGYRFTTITTSGGGVFKVDPSGAILAEIQLEVAPDTIVLFE